jgi:hypothetical protein
LGFGWLALFPVRGNAVRPMSPLRVDGGRFTSERKKGHAAYVRVINTLPADAGTFTLEIKPAAGEKLTQKLQGPYTSLYRPMGAGACTLKVWSMTDPPVTYGEGQANFDINAYATVWIGQKDGAMTISMADDNYDRATATNRIVVRNYFPGAVVDIAGLQPRTYGPPTPANLLPSVSHKGLHEGEAYGFDRLNNDVNLWIEARLPNGKKMQLLRTIQFKNTHRFSLLFGPDSYGDFDTTILIDGPALDAEYNLEAAPLTDGADATKATPAPR